MQEAPGGAGLGALKLRGTEWAGQSEVWVEGRHRRGILAADHSMCTEGAGAQGAEADTGLQPELGAAERTGLRRARAQAEVRDLLSCSCVVAANFV